MVTAQLDTAPDIRLLQRGRPAKRAARLGYVAQAVRRRDMGNDWGGLWHQERHMQIHCATVRKTTQEAGRNRRMVNAYRLVGEYPPAVAVSDLTPSSADLHTEKFSRHMNYR